LLLWLSAGLVVAAHGQHQPQKAPLKKLSRQIDTLLARSDLARAFWGVEIEDQASGRVLYSHNADRLFSPASNAKLFTTAAALALIGPDYRFRTTIESSAPPDKDGVLHGDLTLVGRGDPNLSGRSLPYHLKTERSEPPEHVLAEMADQVVAHGVKQIDGDVVADDSFYVYDRSGSGWAQDDLVWQYGAPVSALAINDNTVFLFISPGAAAGKPAVITVSPTSGYYEIENRLITTPARSGPRHLAIDRQPGSRRITVWGNIPLGSPTKSKALAIEEPADYCANLLAELLRQRGVVLRGHARAHHLEMADLASPDFELAPRDREAVSAGGGDADAADADGEEQPSPQIAHAPNSTAPQPVVLAEHISAPLGEDIRVINKVSQNLHAEMLLRLLGRQKEGTGLVAAGLEVLQGFLAKAGLQPDEYELYDGSGLSRDDLVTPRATVKLLRYAATQSWGAEYLDSLPRAAVDGTLAFRFQQLRRGAVLRAKTGSLKHVNALSGYLTTARGQHLVFSIIVNHHHLTSHEANEAIDEIVADAERASY
jgi:D-alanyl-D-alanine carboxypeptidase/D-alanyl-D-alanine-endopeptidase (penicillin-binding protein 4)